MRKVAAFLVAPLVVAVGVPVLSLVVSSAAPSALPLTILVTYIYGLFFTVVLALPLFLVLKRFRWVNVFSAIFGGLVVGAVGATLVFNGNHSLQRLIALGEVSTLSACAGFVFWLIARKDLQPNKSLEHSRER